MKGIPQIFFMQTFGILLVVFGHSFYLFSPDNPILQWIYAFHMPLFLFQVIYYTTRTHKPTRWYYPGGKVTSRGGHDGFCSPTWSSAVWYSFRKH